MTISMEEYLEKTCKDSNITYRKIYDKEGNKKYWKQFNKSVGRYAYIEKDMNLNKFLCHCEDFDKDNDTFYEFE